MNDTTKLFKRKLCSAFKILRVLQYWCRQNHACCNTCGWAEVPDFHKEADSNVVFYHNQDYDDLKENCYDFYLSWKGDHEEIIKVLGLVGIVASCDDPKTQKIKCLTGNPIDENN